MKKLCTNKPDQWIMAVVDPTCCLVIVLIATAIGMIGLPHSGEQWLDDGPRYCNNGAMVHDWLWSGNWWDPVGFAQENYVKYPAHSVPYHPPGYPLMLGIWYSVVGMSYTSTRYFVALCLGGALCFFYGILRRQGLVSWIAACATLVLATSPEIGRWSRSAMSEIPGMLFILAGSYCFVRWVDTGRDRWCWLAFVLAEIAFFCRVSTAGILPAWFLFLFATQGFRRLISPSLVISAVAYLMIGVVWVKFVSSIAVNEVRQSLGDCLMGCLRIDNLSKWIQGLPEMVGWAILAAAACGLVLAFCDRKSRSFAWFWLLWFLSYYGFQVAQRIHFESRYFIFSLPAICAVVSGLFITNIPSLLWRAVAVLVVIVAIFANVITISHVPQGLQGYDSVAKQLASRDDPGNIFISCWADSDLIFRFRCYFQKHDRQIIRGDRVIAIRLPSYAGVAPQAVAETVDDVMKIIRLGRIRYLVTCSASYATQTGKDRRPADMVLVHETALADPEQFALIGRFTVVFDLDSTLDNTRQEEVLLWRFEGDLPDGKSELPVVIPTANMTLEQ